MRFRYDHSRPKFDVVTAIEMGDLDRGYRAVDTHVGLVAGQVVQYQIVVTIMRFDGQPGGTVMLDTRWRLVGKGGQEFVFRRSTVTEATGGAGHEPLAAAMSRALGTLGQEIAAVIRAQPAGAAATGR